MKPETYRGFEIEPDDISGGWKARSIDNPEKVIYNYGPHSANPILLDIDDYIIEYQAIEIERKDREIANLKKTIQKLTK